MSFDALATSRTQRTFTISARLLSALRLDGPLFTAICLVVVIGLAMVFSASGGSMTMLKAQIMKFALGLIVLLVLAQVPVRLIRVSAPWMYAIGLILLLAVAVVGDIAMGARRWLDLGFIRFQPSEIMKIAVPLACAWYLHERALPPSFVNLAILMVAILIPSALVARQPDLGTALLVAASGAMVLVLAGLRLRYIATAVGSVVAVVVVGTLTDWSFLHGYQRRRVLTLFDPQSDPLGAGYHIIQSQIAIGSGGSFGKGFMNGSQAQLEFLPERTTDFIFAVIGEEWGFFGLFVILMLYLFIIGRGLYLASMAQDTFSRLVAGTISLTFAVYALINTGMVTGLLPVVGVPLPLISYGGTSMVILMAGFGILMALTAKRRLVGR